MIYAKKRLGQHFLRSRRVVERILKAAELKPSDIVLEVGPGTGALTFELVEKVKRVVAVEKDRELAAELKQRLTAQGFQNVEVVPADILKFNPKIYQLKAHHYKLLGNLPYYIASAVIRKFLDPAQISQTETWAGKPSLLVVMVQKEVGERISAKPPNMSLLSVAVQVYGKPEIVTRVPKEAFWPKPQVDGMVVKITLLKIPLYEKAGLDAKTFFDVLKIAFAAPRKQLGGVLSRKFGKEKALQTLKYADIQPQTRAEEISLEKWLTLGKNLTR